MNEALRRVARRRAMEEHPEWLRTSSDLHDPEVTRAYLVDKSVQARERQQVVGERLLELTDRGLAYTCSMAVLAVLFSARDGQDWRRGRAHLEVSSMHADLGQRDFDRAVEVQGLLADAGLHRTVKLPDLVIAACAERRGLTVLHDDADFDRIAGVTGQVTEWLAERGTLD